MELSARQRFLAYVRGKYPVNHIVSPFLPESGVIRNTLEYLGMAVTDDAITNEILLAKKLGYEPMFMTEFAELIFPWHVEKSLSDEKFEVSVIQTPMGDWKRCFPRGEISWNDTVERPVKTEADHEKLVWVCEQVGELEKDIRSYFRNFRETVGEDGVIVAGHPHPAWLGYQISPQMIYLQWADFPQTFKRSMDAIFNASKFIMSIAMEERIDFMSDSSYGLEMTSPKLFQEMDLPYIQAFADWTHRHDGLFWYHNCGFTRKLIMDGIFNTLGADVIETIAAPPEGDNDLAESRRAIDPEICTKGNLNLTLLRDGTPEQVKEATLQMAEAVKGYKHILSTADAVLSGTPPENFIAFIDAAKEAN